MATTKKITKKTAEKKESPDVEVVSTSNVEETKEEAVETSKKVSEETAEEIAEETKESDKEQDIPDEEIEDSEEQEESSDKKTFIVDVEEPKKEEVVEVTPVEKKEAPKSNVRIRLNTDHHCFIGGEHYVFTKGQCYNVPENVKNILNRAGLLAPL